MNYLDIVTTLQSFNDNKKLESPLPARIFAKNSPNVSEIAQSLQSAGHGIYWCINPQIDHNKRSIANTKEWMCTGLDCDMFPESEIDSVTPDQLSLAKQEFIAKIATLELRPTGIIESYKGFYPYWIFTNPLPIKDAEEVNLNYREFVKKLGDKIGYHSEGDNIARVLRVHNTYHLKNPKSPFLVKERENLGNTYDWKELASWIGFDTWLKITPAETTFETQSRTYESIYDVPVKEALIMLSGTALVNFEKYTFTKTAKGHFNIDINGKPSSNFIAPEQNTIGKVGGGASTNIVNWVSWYAEQGITKLNKESIKTALDGILLGRAFEADSWGSLGNDNKQLSSFEDNLWTYERIMSVEVPQDQYLVEGFIPRGCTFLSGPPKSMKSFTSLHLVDCLSNGKPLFGKFDIPKTRKILVMDRENAIWSIKKRFNMLSMQNPNVEYLLIRDSFSDEKFRQKFLNFIKEKAYDVLVLDSFRRFFSGNENDSTEISQFFLFLDRIKDVGVDVVCIHHFNKNSEAKGSNRLRGSSDIVAYFDANINFEKVLDAGVVSLEVEQTDSRHDVEVDKFRVNIIVDENSNMTFSFAGFIDEELDMQSKIEKEVIKFLRNQIDEIDREMLTKRIIKIGFSPNSVSRTITDMKKSHKIACDTRNRKDYYSLGTDFILEGGES